MPGGQVSNGHDESDRTEPHQRHGEHRKYATSRDVTDLAAVSGPYDFRYVAYGGRHVGATSRERPADYFRDNRASEKRMRMKNRNKNQKVLLIRP